MTILFDSTRPVHSTSFGIGIATEPASKPRKPSPADLAFQSGYTVGRDGEYHATPEGIVSDAEYAAWMNGHSAGLAEFFTQMFIADYQADQLAETIANERAAEMRHELALCC